MEEYNIYMPYLVYWALINGLIKLYTTVFYVSLDIKIILHFEHITST